MVIGYEKPEHLRERQRASACGCLAPCSSIAAFVMTLSMTHRPLHVRFDRAGQLQSLFFTLSSSDDHNSFLQRAFLLLGSDLFEPVVDGLGNFCPATLIRFRDTLQSYPGGLEGKSDAWLVLAVFTKILRLFCTLNADQFGNRMVDEFR